MCPQNTTFLDTDILIQTLIAKIQEQQKTIDVLAARINLLEAELAIYKNKKNSNNSLIHLHQKMRTAQRKIKACVKRVIKNQVGNRGMKAEL